MIKIDCNYSNYQKIIRLDTKQITKVSKCNRSVILKLKLGIMMSGRVI